MGDTTLAETLALVAGARLVIGPDSVLVQMANLVGVRALNLSGAGVNFWETGPRALGSRVLLGENVFDIAPGTVAAEAWAMLNDRAAHGAVFERGPGGFEPRGIPPDAPAEFRWALVRALYSGEPFPVADSVDRTRGFCRLVELTELALTHLERFSAEAGRPARDRASTRVLEQVDRLLVEIERLDPAAAVVVRWFQTERLRMPPRPADETLGETKRLFGELGVVASVYASRDVPRIAAEIVRLCFACAPSLRECEFAAVSAPFQELLDRLFDLARLRPDGADWASTLGAIDRALSARDYVGLADRLEHGLAIDLG